MMPRSWPLGKPPSTRPAHHANGSGTSFKNPWPSAGAPTWTELAQSSFPLGWYNDPLRNHEKARQLKVITPDWGRASLEKSRLRKSDCIVGTWLGHASALVELPLAGTAQEGGEQKSAWLLFDPIFSSRAGPTQYTGPSRFRPTPCQVDDLPGCDAVFISHNHYDHLDLSSIKAISKKFPKARYFVPLRNRSWLSSIGLPDQLIFELDWWQNREYGLEDFGHTASQDSTNETFLRFSCVPAQHNSGRSGLDQGSTLWCGWVVEQLLISRDESNAANVIRKGAIYHAGDTGYRRSARSEVVCPALKMIGQRFGPFDISYIPIWRGGTLGFFSYLGLRLSHQDIPSAFHGSPEDAVDIHLDVGSRNTIGIHFGTFVGSENESLEAVIEFAEACDRRGLPRLDANMKAENGRAGILDVGESLAVNIDESIPQSSA